MDLSEETIDATLERDGTLHLSHPPHLPPGQVRVTIHSVAALPRRRTLADVIREIQADQTARGFTGLTVEELAVWEADRSADDAERDRTTEAARAGSA